MRSIFFIETKSKKSLLLFPTSNDNNSAFVHVECTVYCSQLAQRNSLFLFFTHRCKMSSWLLLSFLLHNVHTVSIGLIPSASLTLISSSPIMTMNGTEQTCLCMMVTSSNISALNYFSNNTCQLFSNTSLTNAYFSWTVNINSLFYFLQLPSRSEITEQYTTVTPVLTTAAACASGKQNIFWLSQVYICVKSASRIVPE
jgi:hypothetical protein